MATFTVPAGHYSPITVRGEQRATLIRETNDGSSPDYEFGEETGDSARTFYTPWGDGPEQDINIPQIRADVLGSSRVAIDKTQKFISRTIPMEHEHFLGQMFATRCHISGRKGEPETSDFYGVQTFDEATLNVSYSQLSYNVLTDNELKSVGGTAFPDEGTLLRYVTIDQQTAAKYQTVPALDKLVWTNRAGHPGDGGPTPGDPVVFKNAIILFEGDLVITWHEVPLEAYPITAITALVGRTNRNAFGHALSVAGSYPAQTLICGPPKRKLRRLRNGDLGYDITYAFKYYPQGANKNFFMQLNKTAGYYPFASDVDGTKLLFPLDGGALAYTFEDLFRPEP